MHLVTSRRLIARRGRSLLSDDIYTRHTLRAHGPADKTRALSRRAIVSATEPSQYRIQRIIARDAPGSGGEGTMKRESEIRSAEVAGA